GGDLVLGERRHPHLARHRLLDVRRELRGLLALALPLALAEFGHDIVCEELERLADVLMAIAAALLNEGHLVDASRLEGPTVLAKFIRRADAAVGAGRRQGRPRLLEIGPDVGAARLVLAEDVMMRERIAEEAEAVLAAPHRLGTIVMDGEARHHGDVRIDGVA